MYLVRWLKHRGAALLFAAGLLLVVGGCQDQGPLTGPEPASESLLGGLLSPLLPPAGTDVEVLRRTQDLSTVEVATARVGLLGATLRLPRSGLTVVVPALAAPIGTRITITSPAGGHVGYHFEPHGLRFRLPVLMVQNLNNTEAAGQLLGLSLMGAYFEGPVGPTVNALEILPVQIGATLGGQAILTLRHFSGYVVATNGRASGYRR